MYRRSPPCSGAPGRYGRGTVAPFGTAELAPGDDSPARAPTYPVRVAAPPGGPDARPGRRVGPLTSIVVVAHNQLAYTRRCLESVRRFTDVPYALVLVDNGSTDGTLEYFRSLGPAALIRNEINLGFAPAANQGIRAASSRTVLLLNNDTVVTHNWLRNMLACLESDPTIGLVGPRSNYAAHTWIPVCYRTLEELHAFAREFCRPDPSRWFEVRRWLSGFCLLVRRKVFEKVGLLDERFVLAGEEDVDFSIRARRAGFRLFCAGDAFVHHYGERTRRIVLVDWQEVDRLNRRLFREKWS